MTTSFSVPDDVCSAFRAVALLKVTESCDPPKESVLLVNNLSIITQPAVKEMYLLISV